MIKLLQAYSAPDFEIEHVHLRIELQEKDTQVHSELVIKRNKEETVPLILQGENQVLTSIAIDNRVLEAAEYEVDAKHLTIFNVPQSCVLKMTSVIQPQDNTELRGLYRSGNLFCTQCEAEGFRRITYYLDRPDVMSLFTTTLVACPKLYPVLLSNGNKIESGTLEDGRHWVKWHDPFKKPAYLFAVVAGDMVCLSDKYTTLSNRTIDLLIYVSPDHDKQHCEFAMDALKKSMYWDEQTYGLEYDLESYMIVAVNDFNMGAMENKGLNIFNAQYVLADKKIATDTDFEGVLQVIGHEYFHNWTGNRVTLRDWFQLSLKEGLTVFREQQFFETYCSSPVVSRIQDVRLLRTRQFAEDSGPLAHPVRPESYMEIDNFYTSTVYNKGAEVIRMLNTLLGDKGFKEGFALYFERHDGQAVTIEDFLAAFSAANDCSLSQFKRWYTQAGTPQVNISSSYNAQTQTLTLNCTQQCEATADGSKKEPWIIPIAFELVFENKKESSFAKTDKTVLVLDKAHQSFEFEAIAPNAVPALLGHFSAPIKLIYPYSDKELAILIKYASDFFNRWDACVQLFVRCIKNSASIEILKQALETVLSDVLAGTLSDKAFVAELLTFPSFSYLVEELDASEAIEIQALLEARRSLICEIVSKISPFLIEIYQSCAEDNSNARALKNRALYLLSYSSEAPTQALALQLALTQYHQALNMTDKMGALEVIKNDLSEQRGKILSDFYERYQSYPLVINKWLSLQARSKIPGVLNQVRDLMQHPAFNILTPNQVYALIGGFARANPEYFHEGAKGYEFLADCIIAIDLKNSSVASHLTNELLLWKRLAPPHRHNMKEALEKIRAQPVLSTALLEIVGKALDE